jgi:hypothetical protein
MSIPPNISEPQSHRLRPQRQASKSRSLPPPPQSGDELGSDPSHSSDDYARTVQAKAQALKGHRGPGLTDTEAEDEEAEEEIMQDFGRNKGKKSRTRRSKGKGKQQMKNLSPIAEESPRSTGNTPAPAVLRPGQLSKERVEEIQAFGQRVVDEAKALAVKNGRTVNDVLMLAGLHMRPGRTTNPANEYCSWYAMKHPIPKDSKPS